MSRKHNACLIHLIDKPVLLGGVYKLTQAPQGKDGSAMDSKVMNRNKQIISSKGNLFIFLMIDNEN